MIDLIIPYYNNPYGLQRTLDSINPEIFYVTVIDDGSTQHLSYHPTINQVFRTINQGPGCARQLGIERTINPYIMFIDTGDIFISKEIQKEIIKTISDFPEENIIKFLYYHKDKLTKHTDNRIHGWIYKRDFIKKYNITFCKDSSYLNEDIGFNRACRILTKIKCLDIPIINQIYDENSLTAKENGVALYRDQARALSLVSIHEIETCEKNGIDMQNEINQLTVALYYWFIRTAAERKEYLQDTWSGVRIFYKKFENRININTFVAGNAIVKKCLEFRNKISFPINILRFIDDIWKHENVPDKYLT